jgi:phage-related minor tail protein
VVIHHKRCQHLALVGVHRANEVLVRIVPRADAERALSERVHAALGNALADAGAEARVRVELVRAIEREPGDAAKLKLVRSEVARPT